MKLVPIILALGMLAGCASVPSHDAAPAAEVVPDTLVPLAAERSAQLPRQWAPLIILRQKKPTEYRLVREDGRTVLHARSRQSATGLLQRTDIDPVAKPWLAWRWKVGAAVDTCDQQYKTIEDSPARIILGFDGDKDSLPFGDQLLFETAKVLTGQEMPYATLMYVWDRHLPVGTVMPSRRSNRVKMMVVANEDTGVGKWQHFNRNVIEDYIAAFGEKPGRLIGVGLLTDTDNLGQAVDAWYDDIHLERRAN